MLDEICAELKNYFDVERVFGTFEVKNGKLSSDITDGQYYRIIGSVFNDGIHRSNDVLTDETFRGALWLLAIPPKLVDIANEIAEWAETNKNVMNSPYQSESFGGYSYSKDSDGASWQKVFKKRLDRWRKICPY